MFLEWPLSTHLREINNNRYELTSVNESYALDIDNGLRFNKNRLFLRNQYNYAKKDNVDFSNFLNSKYWHLSFEFENFKGLFENEDNTLFSITPYYPSGILEEFPEYTGQNRSNMGLKITYSFPSGIKVYYSGNNINLENPVLSHSLDVFYDPYGLGGSGGGLSEEVSVIAIDGDTVGGGEGSGSFGEYNYYPYRKHFLEVTQTKVGSSRVISLYIDDILVGSSTILNDTFNFNQSIIVGGYNNVNTYGGGGGSGTSSVGDYIGCVWNLKLSNSPRRINQRNNLFNKSVSRIAFGGNYNLDRTLYMNASSPEYQQETYKELYIYGTTLSVYTEPRTFYLNGVISSFDADVGNARDLYLSGSVTDNFTRTLFIQGASFEGEYTLFIEGQNNLREYTKELYVYGSAGASDSIEDLYNADHLYTYEIPLFISTEASEDAQWEYPLYIKGGNPGSDAYRPLFIQNDAEISEFYRTAIIIGTGTFGGSSQYDLGLPLVMGRVESWGVPMFIGSNTTNSSLQNTLFISGIAGTTATTTLVMPKVSGPADTRTLYIRGGG